MKIRFDHPVTLAAAGFLITAALLGATQAHAQVMQIADDGRVQILLDNYRESDMGSMSMVYWLVVIAAMALLFGGGRIASSMGDLGKGLKAFRREMADVESPPALTRLEAPGDR